MLDISLDALQVMDAIDHRGLFTAAGKELHRVASTMSCAVATLEQDLGVRLFGRIGPRAMVTTAGRVPLEDGRHLLRAAQKVELRVPRGALRWEAGFALGLDSMFAPSVLDGGVAAFYRLPAVSACASLVSCCRMPGGIAGSLCRAAGGRGG